MERTERLLDMLGQIDPDLIAAVDLTPAPKRSAMRKWLPAAACLCLCALLGLTAWRTLPLLAPKQEDLALTDTAYPDARNIVVPGNQTVLEAGGGLIPDTTGKKYDHFTVGECTYTVANPTKSISPTLLGECLGTAEAAHRHPDNDSSMPVTYYRILDIDRELAVAVIFDGEEDIYVFRNPSYLPETLGALMEAASLSQYLTLAEVSEQRVDGEQVAITLYDADTALTEEHLLRPLWDTAPVCVYKNSSTLSPAKDPILLRVHGRLGMFGYAEWTAQLSYNGYLILPLLENYYIFPVTDAVRDGYLAALADKTAYNTSTEPMPMQRGGGSLHGTVTSAEVYHQLTVDGAVYECRTTYWGMDAERVGEELGQVKAGASEFAPMAICYRLSGIAPEAGIAVRFDGEETYYPYFNLDYRPDTLGDLIEDLDLRTILRSGAPTLGYREATVTQTAEFSEANTELLWRHVLSDTDAPAVLTDKRPRGTHLVRVDVQIPLFSGFYDYSLYVSEDGLLYLYLMNISYVFDVDFGREQLGQYANDLILRYPDFELTVSDEVKRPAGERDWETAPDQVRFSGLEWEGTSYATAHESVDPAALGRELGSATAVGLDSETLMLYHKDVTLFAVDGYATRHAVGVRLGEAADCYLYVNRGYVGQTLGDFMEEHGLREKGTLLDFRSTVLGEDTTGSTIQVTGYFTDPLDIYLPAVDPARAWELLMGDPYAPCIDMDTYPAVVIQRHSVTVSFTLRCPGLDDGEITVVLDKKGYLCFEAKENREHRVYEIGRERAEAFLNYVLSDCLESHEIRGGVILIPAGGTRLEAVREQLTKRFSVAE